MRTDLLIENAQIIGHEGLYQLAIATGKINQIKEMSATNPATTRMRSTDIPRLDLQGDWLSLGGIDLLKPGLYWFCLE